MNINRIKNTIKKILISATVGTAMICAGAAITAALVLSEILNPNHISYGLYGILLITGIVLTIITAGDNKAIKTLCSFLSILGILLIGNVMLNRGHISNLVGTLLAVLSGVVLPNMIKINKSVRNSKMQHSKMVNLYKNRK